MGLEVLPIPTLHKLLKLCKSAGHMVCKNNKWDCKEEEVVDVFRKEKFELLALTETKLKENGEVSWWGINGIIADVEEVERAREGVAVLFSEV